MRKWIEFYSPHFPDEEETRAFVEACEQLVAPDNAAKIIMHQAQRLISIADDLPQIRRYQEALQLLFLIMCAENIAKLHDGFDDEGRSKAYVLKFFSDFLSDVDKRALGSGFADHTAHTLPSLGFDRAIELLYNLRCDVVHEGNYADFAFQGGGVSMMNTDPDVIAHLSFREVRDIVVRGCINAVRDSL